MINFKKNRKNKVLLKVPVEGSPMVFENWIDTFVNQSRIHIPIETKHPDSKKINPSKETQNVDLDSETRLD